MLGISIPGTWVIYSAGDANLLQNAFNAIAMIFGDGTYSQMTVIGFLLSIFFVAFRFFVTMKFEAHHIFVSFLIYVVLFVPKATVVIQDIGSGAAYTVANVPVGIAIPGTIVTSIGRNLTELIEEATATPTQAEIGNGYLNSLSVLLQFRDISPGSAGTTGYGSGSVVDYGKTIKNYIESCVMTDMNSPTPALTSEMIWNSTDIWATIGASSYINVDFTTFLPGNTNLAGTQMSCSSGYAAMGDLGTFTSLWYPYINSLLNKTGSTNTAMDNVNNAVSAIGLTSVDGASFMLNALMRNLYQQADVEYAGNFGVNTSETIIKTQAIEQRNVSWAAEQSIFDRYARPFLAFIEMFVILAAPIVGFLVTLGPSGISLAGKYLMVMAWTSLWPPVMAMCNMYIQYSVGQELNGLISAGVNMQTASGMDHLFSTAQEWIATGGMMAAATPILALFLVSGSTHALMTLAGRLSSHGSIDTSVAAPKLASEGAAVNTGHQWEYNRFSGASYKGGSDGTKHYVNAHVDRTEQLSEATQMMQSAGSNLVDAMNRSNDASISSGKGTNRSSSLSNDISQYLDKSAREQSSRTYEALRSSGLSESSAHSVMNQASVGIAAGLPLAVLLPGLSSSYKSDSGSTAINMAQAQEALKTGFSETSSLTSGVRTSASAIKSLAKNTYTDASVKGTDGQTVSAALSNAETASRTMSHVTGLGSVMGAYENMAADVFTSSALEKAPEEMKALVNTVMNNPVLAAKALSYKNAMAGQENSAHADEEAAVVAANTSIDPDGLSALGKVASRLNQMNGIATPKVTGNSVDQSADDKITGVRAAQTTMEQEVKGTGNSNLPTSQNVTPASVTHKPNREAKTGNKLHGAAPHIQNKDTPHATNSPGSVSSVPDIPASNIKAFKSADLSTNLAAAGGAEFTKQGERAVTHKKYEDAIDLTKKQNDGQFHNDPDAGGQNLGHAMEMGGEAAKKFAQDNPGATAGIIGLMSLVPGVPEAAAAVEMVTSEQGVAQGLRVAASRLGSSNPRVANEALEALRSKTGISNLTLPDAQASVSSALKNSESLVMRGVNEIESSENIIGKFWRGVFDKAPVLATKVGKQ